MYNYSIPKDLRDKYDFNIDMSQPVQSFGGVYGTIDFRTITSDRVEMLLRHKFPHITKKGKVEKGGDQIDKK